MAAQGVSVCVCVCVSRTAHTHHHEVTRRALRLGSSVERVNSCKI
jgi:hypothetical protein